MKEKDNDLDANKKLQSDIIDISYIFLILKHKFLFFISVTILLTLILVNKTLKEEVFFSTQGLVYVEKEGDFLDLKDKILKKILPDYDESSRKTLINEYFTSPVVIQNAIVKSGFNAYLSDKRDSKYNIPTFLTWKLIYHKDIQNLIPSNQHNNLYVDNTTIDNIYSSKAKLVIKFVDYNEFKIYDKINSKYLATSRIDKKTIIKDMCTFILHRKEENKKKYYDPNSPLLELPEQLYLTINDQNSYQNEMEKKIELKGAASALVEVSLTGNNPYMISNYTKKLIDEFIHFNINVKLKNIDKIYSFMLQERKDLEKKRDKYLNQLKKIRNNADTVIDLNYFKTSSVENNSLKSTIRKNKIELKKLAMYKQHLINNKDITKLALSSHPIFSSISPTSNKFNDLLGKFLIIKTKYTQESLVYKDAMFLLKKQKELLILEIDYKEKELMMSNEKIIQSYNNSVDELIKSVLAKDKIDFIKNNIAMLEDTYKNLYKNERNLLYNKVLIKYSNKILKNPTISTKPTNRITGKIIANFLIALVLAIIITIIKHLLFPLFLSRIIINKMTSSQIIGGVPKIKKKFINSEGLINLTKEYRIAELFTTMETLIFFHHPEIKIIQFTSPYPKDGKTFIARNIAQSLASNNAKVILVNMDLDFEKKQKLQKINSAQDLKKSIKKIKLYNKKDLYILPFNTTEQNMQIDAKLDKYKKILISLKNSFDYVILDTPQYPMYSESLSLSSIVDLSISVVKLNHTPAKISGKHFRDIASFSKKHIIIINNDLININSSGYTFIDKKDIKHIFVRLKQKISQI